MNGNIGPNDNINDCAESVQLMINNSIVQQANGKSCHGAESERDKLNHCTENVNDKLNHPSENVHDKLNSGTGRIHDKMTKLQKAYTTY